MVNKHLISILCILWICITGAMAQATSLNLTLKDGTVHTYLLSNLPVVTMADNQLVITSNDATASYPLYTVKQYTFGDALAVSTPKEDVKIIRSADELIIRGIKESTSWGVFSMDGKRLSVPCTVENSQMKLTLTSLPAGIYLIKAGEVKFKITKK